MKKFLLLILTIVICLFVAACGNEKTQEKEVPASVPAATASAPTFADIDKHITDAVKGIEKNSSDMVDTIAKLAKNDAKQANDSDIKRALTFLKAQYPNYFSNNEIMEKSMYYGNLLDYAFDDNDARGRAGYNLVKSVKYVYRGTEKVEDEATQNNLKKIQKELAKIK